MDQTLTARYAREVQKVQRKKEEVDQLMAEAKRLDGDNRSLITTNTSLKSEVNDLKTKLQKREEEFTILQTQVKKQQLRLQHFIDQEANSASGKATKAAEEEKKRKDMEAKHQTQVAELTKRLEALHDSRKSLSEALELYKESSAVLTAENEKLREEVKQYDGRLEKTSTEFKQKEERLVSRVAELEGKMDKVSHDQKLADAETAEISTLDLQAKDALKAEFLALVTEVDRLQNEVEHERNLGLEAKKEAAREAEQLIALRKLSEESARLSATEVDALSAQQETILRDLKSAVKDREELVKRERELKAKVGELENALTAAATPNPEAPKAEETPLSISAPALATSQLDEATQAEMQEQREQLAQQQEKISALQNQIDNMQANLSNTHGELETSMHVRDELLSNQELRAEKEELHQELYAQLQREKDLLETENKLLQTQLDDAMLQVRRTKAATTIASGISSQELNEVDTIIHSLLAFSTQVLHDVPSSSTGGATSRSSSVNSDQSMTDGSGALILPTVRCDRYEAPGLNAVHRKLGGIQYVMKKLKSRIRRVLANSASVGRGRSTSQQPLNPAATGTAQRPLGVPPLSHAALQQQQNGYNTTFRQVNSDVESLGSQDGVSNATDPDGALARAAQRLSSTPRQARSQSRGAPTPQNPARGGTTTQNPSLDAFRDAIVGSASGNGAIDLRSMIAESEQLLRAVEAKH